MKSSMIAIVLVVLLATGTAYADLSDGLVGHYPLDGNANDESGNEKHGTEHGGVSFVSGIHGLAASFDGFDDYIAVPSNDIGSLAVFTVSLWAKLRFAFPDTQAIILIHDRLNGDSDPNKHFQFMLDPRFGTNALVSGWEASGGADRVMNVDTFWEDYGTDWVHLVESRDSGGNGKLYVNGQLKGATSGSIETSNTDDFMIGAIRKSASAGSEAYFFNGFVDDIRIYNRVLSEEEIIELYNPAPGYYLKWWGDSFGIKPTNESSRTEQATHEAYMVIFPADTPEPNCGYDPYKCMFGYAAPMCMEWVTTQSGFWGIRNTNIYGCDVYQESGGWDVVYFGESNTIPTLSGWGLCISFLLILVSAVWILRRRNAK